MKRSLELKTIFILYFIIIRKIHFFNFLFNGTKNIQNNEYIYIYIKQNNKYIYIHLREERYLYNYKRQILILLINC